MDLPIGMQASELLPSQAHIWNHSFNFINSMSLKCAVQLGIPDIIHNHGKPMSLPDLVQALPINKAKAPCIYRLMRILIHAGFFTKQNNLENEEEEDSYALTPASCLLLKDDPFSVTPFLLATLDPIQTTPFHFLSEWFQNDSETPFEMAHGRTFWDYASREPRLNNFFNDSMASDARLVTSVMIKECAGVFEGLNSLLDVGGGTGTVARAIVDAFPPMKCSVLELPHVVADMEGSDNLVFVAGDMFESIPSADAVLLKSILHDWNDEECVKILRRCKEAIPCKGKGGKVIIIDMVLDSQKGHPESTETQLCCDMAMMTMVTGRERNEKEWEKLFLDAGFSNYKIAPILGLRSIIEVYP
ncbi:hypothetical protein RJ639_011134 [Escallonia herrerae]|uniref:Trans-resveratrol di-O-methyltransferase-like n=1 Tax=Escallonia herrerae TaxID=1293975 RepID=A0AA88VL53_9ASTE|nr:hypothetical protein RJ639_011133 [Escallonia herrerae]KAK3010073.1 hypothetical protein RJ639_011134 [Escallonia herrerae]